MSKTKHILSINDLSKEEILQFIKKAKEFKEKGVPKLLSGKVMASCFFEPSTRTQLSFASAMKRLGGEVIGFSDANVTSAKKGETLPDMMKVIASYADIIVMRHPEEGSAKLVSQGVTKPVINAGDGSNEHPTQTLLDLFSIQECQGKLDDLNIVISGDLKHSRTVHSLALALRHFNVKLFLVSPKSLLMPQNILEKLSNKYSIHESFDEVIKEADIFYATRIQEERFVDQETAKKVKNLILSKSSLNNVKNNLRILHPLPRRDEIALDVDDTPFAYYFVQAENGLYMRMACLCALC